MPAPLRFRAWHVEQKRMYSPEEMGADELTLAVDGRGLVNVSGVSTRQSQYAGDRMIVMQSTGLNDRNGVEIFEDDVVEAATAKMIDGSPIRERVQWDQGECCFLPFSTGDGCGCCSGRLYPDNVVVIGNAHLNADLLTTPATA